MKLTCPKCDEEIEVNVIPEIITTGLEFEDFLWRQINAQEGLFCERTKTSGDQGVDLIVTTGGKKIAVQCKLYSEPVGNSAVQEVIAGKIIYKCDYACVITNSTFTKSATDLANAAEVELLDYKECIRYFRSVAGGMDEHGLFEVKFEKAIANGDFQLAENFVDEQIKNINGGIELEGDFDELINILLSTKVTAFSYYIIIFVSSKGTYVFGECAMRVFARMAEVLARLSCAEDCQTISCAYLLLAQRFYRDASEEDGCVQVDEMITRMCLRGAVNVSWLQNRHVSLSEFLFELVNQDFWGKILGSDMIRAKAAFKVFTCDDQTLMRYASDGDFLASKIFRKGAYDVTSEVKKFLLDRAIDEAKSGRYKSLFSLVREGDNKTLKRAVEIAKKDYKLMVELASAGVVEAQEFVAVREELEGGIHTFISRIKNGDEYAKERLRCLVKALTLETVEVRYGLTKIDAEFVRQMAMESYA